MDARVSALADWLRGCGRRRCAGLRRSTPLAEAWAVLRTHRIKALPDVDAFGGIIGMVTPADFNRP